jgi:hypothetical protein
MQVYDLEDLLGEQNGNEEVYVDIPSTPYAGARTKYIRYEITGLKDIGNKTLLLTVDYLEEAE